MRRLSVPEYLASPIDGWTCGDGWVHFCTRKPHLTGALTWGRLHAEACDALLICSNVTCKMLPRHPALLDGKHSTSVDAVSFRIASEYVLRNAQNLREGVLRFAAVRPRGFAGASAEGFFRIVPAPYPVAVFGERRDALSWLGCDEYTAVVDEIEHLAPLSAASETLVSELRREIRASLVDASLSKAAKKLRVSVRSLQRGLHAQGTSFQRELSIIRVRAAQALMLETDLSLTEIAMETGFASSATFSFVFKKSAGMSPSAWRERRSARKRSV